MGVRALLLAPTRELALQTAQVVDEFIRFTDLRSVLLVGGSGMERQFEDLSGNPDMCARAVDAVVVRVADS